MSDDDSGHDSRPPRRRSPSPQEPQDDHEPADRDRLCPNCNLPIRFVREMGGFRCRNCQRRAANPEVHPAPQGPAPQCPTCTERQVYYEVLNGYRCGPCMLLREGEQERELPQLPVCTNCIPNRHLDQNEFGEYFCWHCEDRQRQALENATPPGTDRGYDGDREDEEFEEWPEHVQPPRNLSPQAEAPNVQPNQSEDGFGPRLYPPRMPAPVDNRQTPPGSKRNYGHLDPSSPGDGQEDGCPTCDFRKKFDEKTGEYRCLGCDTRARHAQQRMPNLPGIQERPAEAPFYPQAAFVPNLQIDSNSQSSFGGHGSRQEYLNYKDKSLHEWLVQIPPDQLADPEGRPWTTWAPRRDNFTPNASSYDGSEKSLFHDCSIPGLNANEFTNHRGIPDRQTQGPPRMPPGSSMVQRGQGQPPTGQSSPQIFHDSLHTIQVPHGGPLIIPPTERASRQVVLDTMRNPRYQNPGAMMSGTSRVYTNRHDFTNAVQNPLYQNPGYSMQVPPLRMSSTIYHRPIAPRGPNPGTRQQGPPRMSAPMYHRPIAPGSSQAYSNVQNQRQNTPRKAFQNPDQHPRGPNPGTRQQGPPQIPAPMYPRQAGVTGPSQAYSNVQSQRPTAPRQAFQNPDQHPRGPNPGTRQQGPPQIPAPMYPRPPAPGSSQAYSYVQSQRPTAPRQAFQNPDQHPRGPNPGARLQAPPQEPPAPVDQRRQAAAPGPNHSFVNARHFWINQQQANQIQDGQAQNPRARNAPPQAPPQDPQQRRRG